MKKTISQKAHDKLVNQLTDKIIQYELRIDEQQYQLDKLGRFLEYRNAVHHAVTLGVNFTQDYGYEVFHKLNKGDYYEAN